MKFKPTNKAGEVVVELGPREEQLPSEALPVFHLKKVLVPVDFSGCSKKALGYAIPFARQFNAEVLLLHVVGPCVAVPEMGPVDFETMEEARRDLDQLASTLPAEVRRSTALRSGQPQIEIIHAARDLGADLIIISTHGRTGLARAIMGSVAEKVVRHATCPVLVVRENEKEFVTERETDLAA